MSILVRLNTSIFSNKHVFRNIIYHITRCGSNKHNIIYEFHLMKSHILLKVILILYRVHKIYFFNYPLLLIIPYNTYKLKIRSANRFAVFAVVVEWANLMECT